MKRIIRRVTSSLVFLAATCTPEHWSNTYLLASQDVLAQLDLAEGALSERLDQDVVADGVLRLARSGLASCSVGRCMATAPFAPAIFGAGLGAPLLMVCIAGSVRLALGFLLPALPGAIQIV